MHKDILENMAHSLQYGYAPGPMMFPPGRLLDGVAHPLQLRAETLGKCPLLFLGKDLPEAADPSLEEMRALTAFGLFWSVAIQDFADSAASRIDAEKPNQPESLSILVSKQVLVARNEHAALARPGLPDTNVGPQKIQRLREICQVRERARATLADGAVSVFHSRKHRVSRVTKDVGGAQHACRAHDPKGRGWAGMRLDHEGVSKQCRHCYHCQPADRQNSDVAVHFAEHGFKSKPRADIRGLCTARRMHEVVDQVVVPTGASARHPYRQNNHQVICKGLLSATRQSGRQLLTGHALQRNSAARLPGDLGEPSQNAQIDP